MTSVGHILGRMSELVSVPHRPEGIPPLTRGWRMRMAMEQAGKSRDELAAILGVSRATVTRWMHDIGRQPRRPDMEVWARECKVPIEWLAPQVGDDIPEQPTVPKITVEVPPYRGVPGREARRRLRVVRPPLDLGQPARHP